MTSLSFEPLQKILHQILQRNGLDEPDGRPLYKYRVKGGELSRLGHSLKVRANGGAISSRTDGAAFCLYFAERFRTEHKPGPWKWETVTHELDMEHGGPEFYNVLMQGLVWWHRAGHLVRVGTQRRFLVTLACEGGLPQSLLSKDGGYLRRYLRRLLGDHEAFPMMIVEDLAESLGYLLPKTLANAELFTFSSRLVEAVVELRKDLDLGGNPIAELDRADPNWRDRVPLRMDDDVAAELLTGLLTAERGEAVERAMIHMDMELDLGSEPGVRRIARPPSSIPAKSFSDLVLISDLPPRFRLSLRSSSGEVHPFAKATSMDGGETIRFEKVWGDYGLDGEAVLDRYDLLLSSGGSDLAVRQLPGGEADEGAPWVFQDLEGETTHRSLGVGNVSTRYPSVLVVLPKGARIEEAEHSFVEELPILSREVYKLTGTGRIHHGEEVFQVATGRERDEGAQYRLVGEQLSIGVGSNEFWLGMPTLQVSRNEGPFRNVPANEIDWKQTDRAYGNFSSRIVGEGILRHRIDGVTGFRSKLIVLPERTRVEQRAAKFCGNGQVTFLGLEGASITIEDIEGVSFSVNEDQSGLHLVYSLKGAIHPPNVTVDLRLRTGERLSLQVGLPVEFVGFTVGVSKPLADQSVIPLRMLRSIRATVVGLSGPFFLEVTGEAVDRQRIADLVPFAIGDPDECFERHELLLDEVASRVEQLLAVNWKKESEIELRICSVGFEQVGYRGRIHVARFDRRLEAKVIGMHSATNFKLKPIISGVDELSIRDLHEPSKDLELGLRAMEGGDWYLETARVPCRHALAVAHRRGELLAWPQSIRGGLVDATDVSLSSEEVTPRDLVEILGVGGEEAESRLYEMVGELGANPDHREWGQVLKYAAALEEFPPRTFSILPLFVKEPAALAMFVLQATYRERTFSALWDRFERLPCMWHLVKLDDILDAGLRMMESFKRLHKSLAPELKDVGGTDPSSRMRGVVRMFREQAPRRAPFLDLVADALSMESKLLVMPESDLGRLAASRKTDELDTRLEELRNQLRIRHSRLEASDWPNRKDLDMVVNSAKLPKSEVPWVQAQVQHTSEIVNAPMVAAAIQASDVGQEPEQKAVGALKFLRAFDPIWFDEAHAIGLAKLINKTLERRLAILS